MSSLRLLVHILRVLWRSGFLRLSPLELLAAMRALWRCGSSYATLAMLAAARFPDRCAIHDEDRPLTFAELLAQSEALASTLGLRPGQQAALLCRNTRGFVVGLLALSRLGVDVLVMNPDSPVASLRRILEGQRVDLLLHDAELAPALAEAAPDSPRHSVTDVASSRPQPRLPRVRHAGHIVVLTSGSTGAPKGIRRRPSLASLLPTVAGLLDGLPVELHRPSVLAIPLYHGYGLATLALTLALGAPLHIARRSEVGQLLERLPEHARAILVTVPTLLHRWLHQQANVGSDRLAVIVSGSAPLEAGLCTQILERCGPILFNLYGSTECGIMAMATPQALTDAPGSVGRPLAGTTMRIVDEAHRPVAAGTLGRISVCGPLVLHPDADGWRDTGDIGRLDEAGRLFVCGRSDSMFVSGGENVYPEETERVLLQHPALLDAAVSVVPDTEFGQRMVAWVVAQPGASFDQDWLRDRLERHQLPRSIHLVSKIPRNALGKLDRTALAAMEEPAPDMVNVLRTRVRIA